MGSHENDKIAITHFTSQYAAAQILNGWRHEILQQTLSPAKDFGPNELSLRLSSRYGMNDPTEQLHNPRTAAGSIGNQAEHRPRRTRLIFPDTAFIYCGSKAVKNEELNRLDLWRAYGANGQGIAITTVWSKKGLNADGYDILNVKYITTAKLASLKKQYENLQEKIDKAIADKLTDKARDLHKERMELEVGYKNSDYKSEDEIRIVYYAGDKSSSSHIASTLNFTAEGDRLRAYITRKVSVGAGRTLSGLHITIGPRVPEYEASHWKLMADWTVRQLGLSDSRSTQQSKLTYVG